MKNFNPEVKYDDWMLRQNLNNVYFIILRNGSVSIFRGVATVKSTRCSPTANSNSDFIRHFLTTFTTVPTDVILKIVTKDFLLEGPKTKMPFEGLDSFAAKSP